MMSIKKINVRFCSLWFLWFLLLMNMNCFKYSLSDFLNAEGPPPKGGVGLPVMPQGFKAVVSGGQVMLSWATQEGVSYDLFHSITAGFSLESGTKISGVTSPHVHTSLMADTTYYYRLTAVNSVGASAPTEEVSARTPPAAPQGFTAAALNLQVTLSWTIEEDVTYNLFYSRTQGFEPASGTKISGVTPPYPQTGLMEGATYYYRLTANNSWGASTPTEEILARTQPATPQIPTVLASDSQVTLTWEVKDGVTYELFHSRTQGFELASGTKVPNATSPYIHTGLTNGTTYYYRLKAANSAGESAATDEVSGTPQP